MVQKLHFVDYPAFYCLGWTELLPVFYIIGGNWTPKRVIYKGILHFAKYVFIIFLWIAIPIAIPAPIPTQICFFIRSYLSASKALDHSSWRYNLALMSIPSNFHRSWDN